MEKTTPTKASTVLTAGSASSSPVLECFLRNLKSPSKSKNGRKVQRAACAPYSTEKKPATPRRNQMRSCRQMAATNTIVLQCSVCKEQASFKNNEIGKQWNITVCGHVMCKVCMQQLVDNHKKRISCPTCRKVQPMEMVNYQRSLLGKTAKVSTSQSVEETKSYSILGVASSCYSGAKTVAINYTWSKMLYRQFGNLGLAISVLHAGKQVYDYLKSPSTKK